VSSAPAALSQVRAFGSLVRLSHSVFALPFALLSLLAATNGRPSWRLLALVVAAVVTARTAAMAYNRFADRAIDAANPRTRDREIPRGAVTPAAALALTAVAGAAFVACCWLLAPICGWLSLPTLLWLLGYSHVKRFSSLCHLWLGVALGISPSPAGSPASTCSTRARTSSSTARTACCRCRRALAPRLRCGSPADCTC
jgi:4-hydroxybenzoate polyprenyltransferase